MKLGYTLLLTLALTLPALSQETIRVTDADLTGDTETTWTSGNTYVLDGLVYLESGGTLNIEAGTTVKAAIKADVTTGDNTSALIISRGAQIFARGTAAAPIIFTAEQDDLDDADDLGPAQRGLWGGLILLGNAPITFSAVQNSIEGITANIEKAQYGGDDPEDNSGVLNYVSIRHGGFSLTGGSEINGLTLGGVGSGTEIDYVEVFANSDDGIEWFGGTVNVSHASVAFCGDDGMDYDLGWKGKGQFWFVIQEPDAPGGTGRAGEHDGADPDSQMPFSQPTIYNATYIGVGTDGAPDDGDAADPDPKSTYSVVFRDNAGGYYNNSVFTGYNGAAIGIEQRDDETPDSYDRLTAGDLALNNNLFSDFAAGDAATDLFLAVDPNDEKIDGMASDTVAARLTAAGNEIGETGIAGISRTNDGGLDPRINADGAALTGGVASDDEYFAQVTYRGAFGNSANWLEGWTALDQNGFLGDLVTPESNNADDCITIDDSDLDGTEHNWTSDNCYNLDGLVYLEEDGILNIEAGTVIRGLGVNSISTGDNASALIISRGAQIFARGTADEPIIFTAQQDDLDDPTDLDQSVRGQWGGLVVLGNAPITAEADVNGIEGIVSSEERARFGGDNAEDNSGVLNYVSIRHGGFALSSGNEINGLTLGGVGSGTEIDYIEVFANLDDGIEWFGGSVRVDHASVSYCGDDGIDYDNGWLGGGQYWFVLQGPNDVGGTGRAGEHDGAQPDANMPFSNPTIYNATYVGIGEGELTDDGDAADAAPKSAYSVLFRDNAAGSYNNSIFIDYNDAAIAVEQRSDDTPDSYDRLIAGELTFNNNLFFGFGAGTTPGDLFIAVDPNDEKIVGAASDSVAARFVAMGNEIVDPQLNSILDDRDDVGGNIDPRPFAFGRGATGATVAAAGFDTTSYYGAFEVANGLGNPSWISGWTALSELMLTNNVINSVGQVDRDGFVLQAPVPNPAYATTRIEFELPRAARVSITVLDLLGRPVARRTGDYRAGEQFETLNVSELPNGTYLVVLDAAGSRIVQKLAVSH